MSLIWQWEHYGVTHTYDPTAESARSIGIVSGASETSFLC